MTDWKTILDKEFSEKLSEKFKNDLSLKVSELLIGDPSKTETQFGSISSI